MSMTTAGTRCTRTSILLPLHPLPVPEHMHVCSLHRKMYTNHVTRNGGTHHEPGRCVVALTNHTWCPNAAREGEITCVQHHQRNERRIARLAETAQIRTHTREVVNGFRLRDPIVPWRDMARELYDDNGLFAGDPLLDRETAVFGYYRVRHPIAMLPHELNFVWQYVQWLRHGGLAHHEPQPGGHWGHAGGGPPPPTPLAAIALDHQNVHRAVVSEQTNRSTALLLATPNTPENLRSHELLAAYWLNHRIAPWDSVRLVVDDMAFWRKKETCRIEGDRLYRRLIAGLYLRVARLKDKELVDQLMRRFYEECAEAMGMCCEGHISRLCNVLVGFDDEFKPPVPVGEILQAKMAAISELEISTEEKIAQATAVMTELGIAPEARGAWLEAF